MYPFDGYPPFWYYWSTMPKKIIPTPKKKDLQLPLIVEKDEDGFYVVECHLFEGCYTQGRTLDEALKNIRAVLGLVVKEKEGQKILRTYRPREISFHTISL